MPLIVSTAPDQVGFLSSIPGMMIFAVVCLRFHGPPDHAQGLTSYGTMVYMLYMRSVKDDRTARAVIRDEALRLFAAQGPDAVTVRQIAAAAGVSPALVVHHFGSKEGLREVVDEHVLGLFDAMLGEMTGEAPRTCTTRRRPGRWPRRWWGTCRRTPGARLPAPAAAGRRGGRPGVVRRLYRISASGRALVQAGMAAPGADPAVRAAFLMANDLAVLLLRDHLAEVLGVDPLSEEGMARWAGEMLTIYAAGLPAAPEGALP